MAAPHPDRQRAARERLDQLFAYPAAVLAIHYACESFASGRGSDSPRITAIAATNLGTGETQAFSISAEAELLHLPPLKILARLDELETALLQKFFTFLALSRAMRFVHWNMRNAVYGFEALEHRSAVLGGQPIHIPDSQKLDLARLLTEIYGTGYVAQPAFETLARDNGLRMAGMLTGLAEPEAFVRGDYLAVQRSVLAKVGVIAELTKLTHDRTLKTRANWWTMNIGRAREAYELFDRNPVRAWAGLIFGGLGFGFLILRTLAGWSGAG